MPTDSSSLARLPLARTRPATRLATPLAAALATAVLALPAPAEAHAGPDPSPDTHASPAATASLDRVVVENPFARSVEAARAFEDGLRQGARRTGIDFVVVDHFDVLLEDGVDPELMSLPRLHMAWAGGESRASARLSNPLRTVDARTSRTRFESVYQWHLLPASDEAPRSRGEVSVRQEYHRDFAEVARLAGLRLALAVGDLDPS
jgi:hypothetical protein